MTPDVNFCPRTKKRHIYAISHKITNMISRKWTRIKSFRNQWMYQRCSFAFSLKIPPKNSLSSLILGKMPNLRHFHIKLNAYQVKLYIFQINLDILDIKASIFASKLKTLQKIKITFDREMWYYLLWKITFKSFCPQKEYTAWNFTKVLIFHGKSNGLE